MMKVSEINPLTPTIISLKQKRRKVIGILKSEISLNDLITEYDNGKNVYIQYLDMLYTPKEFKRQEDNNTLNRLDTAIVTGQRTLRMSEMFEKSH